MEAEKAHLNNKHETENELQVEWGILLSKLTPSDILSPARLPFP